MIEFDTTIRIDRTPGRVFPVLADFETYLARWAKGPIAAIRADGDGGNGSPVAAARRAVDTVNNRSIGDRGRTSSGMTWSNYSPAATPRSLRLRGHDHRSCARFRLNIEDIFGIGDRATVRLRMSGTRTGAPLLGQPATGRRLSANAVFNYRATEDRMAEVWQIVDGLASASWCIRLSDCLRAVPQSNNLGFEYRYLPASSAPDRDSNAGPTA